MQLLRAIRMNMQLVDEHERVSRGDVEQIVQALVVHLRTRWPLSLSTLDTGPVGKVEP